MEKEEGMKAEDRGIFFNVKNCPQDTFARFHKYCDDVSKEAGLTFASYPLGIKSMLDKVEPIGESEDSQEEKKEGLKTFGKGE